MTTLAPPTHELERQLRTLSLSGMAQTLLARNQEAISHQLAYTEFVGCGHTPRKPTSFRSKQSVAASG